MSNPSSRKCQAEFTRKGLGTITLAASFAFFQEIYFLKKVLSKRHGDTFPADKGEEKGYPRFHGQRRRDVDECDGCTVRSEEE